MAGLVKPHELRALRVEVAKAAKEAGPGDTRDCLLDVACDLLECERRVEQTGWCPGLFDSMECAERALAGDFTYRLEG